MSSSHPAYKPVLLSLGSNIGNRQQYLERAVTELAVTGSLVNVQVSSVYETEPVGFKEQNNFLNIAISCWTILDPKAVFTICKGIEKKLGRTKRLQWQEREIDIDLLLIGDSIIDKPNLQIPHPAMHERRFVLTPSVEIAASLLHPVFKKTIQELYNDCTDTSSVVRVGDLLLPL